MAKVSKKKIQSEKFGEYVNNLWSAFTLLESKQQIRLLFKDLFSHTEFTMFTKRLEIARRLLTDQPYEIIKQELNVTDGTISHINNILNTQGQGLKLAHQKLSALEAEKLKRQQNYNKQLENPWLNKIKRKTLLGVALKVGAVEVDKIISKKLKQRSAKTELKY